MSAARALSPPVPMHALSLAAGLAILAALWLGPLVPMSLTAFSPHMMLHLGLVVLAAPLLAFPLAARLPTPQHFGVGLQWYLLAGTFEMVAVWGWHVPLLHDAAGRFPAAFLAEQASFLAGGVALWAAAFTAGNRQAARAAAVTLFFAFAHTSMFGLVLTLAPSLLYDSDLCRGAFGLDRLNDQHFGGALMTIGAGLPLLLATAVACFRALSDSAF